MTKFIHYLKMQNLSMNTINAYCYSVQIYSQMFSSISKDNLLIYKSYLIENNKAKTVNLRIQGMNKYLSFINKRDLSLKCVKVNTQKYLENVISQEDYVYFTKKLKEDENWKWYFLIKFLACTGARVSEVVNLKVEHINAGYIDMYGKSSKVRRIYIPIHLTEEIQDWCESISLTSGHLFLNRSNKPITTRGIAHQIKKLSIKYNLNPKVIYPHSFRHRFAKNFIEKYQDLSLLADLLGHESIETTRIYLRRSTMEQKMLVDKIVTW